MATAKDIGRNATRPTSVVVMLLLWKAFQMKWPDAMPPEWESWTLDAITIVGGTGIIDKLWRNRKDIREFFKSIINKLKKKEREHGKSEESVA